MCSSILEMHIVSHILEQLRLRHFSINRACLWSISDNHIFIISSTGTWASRIKLNFAEPIYVKFLISGKKTVPFPVRPCICIMQVMKESVIVVITLDRFHFRFEFKRRVMGPLFVFVFSCFRENMIVTCIFFLCVWVGCVCVCVI